VNNTLELKVILGRMGKLEVKGNRYFKKRLLTKKVTIKKGEPFNYNQLRSDLYNINQYPDRNVQTVLTPGAEPGETDVLFNVQDRLPIHVGFSYDTFGSRYLGRERYLGTVTDNNLLGFDDIFTFQFQQAEANAYRLQSFRYLLPVTNATQVGIYATRNQIEMQHEFKDVMARGKAEVYGAFINHTLINGPDFKMVANLGFDYKNVYNFLLGLESSRDRERVLKAGLNMDYADAWRGRNIINNEIDFGIPNIMGGSKAVDTRSSIVGAGGRFTKDVFDYLRLQTLPFDSTLLFKSEAQFSSRILPSTEQYQLGGISNVRGFAPGEAVGDSGQTLTTEFGLPVYGLPRSIRVPFSSANLHDALRVALFYDWGHVSLRNPQPGQAKERSLDSLGCGVRLTLPENFFIRVDLAWPVSGEPGDHRGEHTWLQVSKEF
jgi:hemolysin activation/secretion protein